MFRDVNCFVEITTLKLIDIRIFIQQYVGMHVPQSGLLMYAILSGIFQNIYSLTRTPGLESVSIQESSLKIFSFFGNILRII